MSHWLEKYAHGTLKLPEQFNWDFSTIIEYSSCGTSGCAIGLYKLMSGQRLDSEIDTRACRYDAVLADQELHDMFYRPDFYGKNSYNEVTPLDVSRAITKYLETKNAT